MAMKHTTAWIYQSENKDIGVFYCNYFNTDDAYINTVTFSTEYRDIL